MNHNSGNLLLSKKIQYDNDNEVRLDQFLVNSLQDYSRSLIQKSIKNKTILVNQKPVKPNYLLKQNDMIQIELFGTVTTFEPKPLDFEVVYEDSEILVINKEAGVIVHPGAGTHAITTLAEGVAHYSQVSSIGKEEFRPGVVHRLDKDTTGLIVIAKTDTAHQHLAEQFQVKSAKRYYLALAQGKWTTPTITVEKWQQRHNKDRRKMMIVDEELKLKSAKLAKTEFTQISSFINGRFSLLLANLWSGRTHQIRVQLHDQGNSVVGDPVYKLKVDTQHLRSHPKLLSLISDLNEQLLHAFCLQLIHPMTHKPMIFYAKPHQRFIEFLDFLKPFSSNPDIIGDIQEGKLECLGISPQ